jgi:hypothetical protein
MTTTAAPHKGMKCYRVEDPSIQAYVIYVSQHTETFPHVVMQYDDNSTEFCSLALFWEKWADTGI